VSQDLDAGSNAPGTQARRSPPIPVLTWWKTYDRRWVRADVVAGLAAGAVVVPQAMAYATIADMPVEIGLYTCMVPMLVYVLLGGSRAMSVSTTSTVAVLTASTLVAAGLVAGSDDVVADLSTLVLMVGVILLIARVLHLGNLIENISEAVLVGLKTGVGLTVAVGQLPKLLGITIDPDADHFFSELRSVIDHLSDTSVVTLVFSTVTVAVLLLMSRYVPKVPGPLVAVVGGILAVAIGNLDEHGLALIAKVPSGLPTPHLPPFDHVTRLLPGAIAIALMVYLETITVARTVRTATEPPIDNDQELFAVGAASFAGAFFQSLPAAGGFSQTAVNQRSGARSQVSEVTTVVLAVLVALFLGAVLDDLPQATLGAMVFVAVVGLIKPADWVRLAKVSRLELIVATVTASVALVAGMLVGVAFGVVGTLYLLLHEINHAPTVELRPNAAGLMAPATPDSQPVPRLLVLRVLVPLYTGNARVVQRAVLAAVDAAEVKPDVVILDATAVAGVTTTVIEAGRETEQQLSERGVELWLASLEPHAEAGMRHAPRWQELVDARRIHATVEEAVTAFRQRRSAASDEEGSR
jgi:high affinity sulfate transporter 1